MSLPPAFLDELRARVPLSGVVARRVKLIRAGREMKGCCPFHNEKTPSFYVNDDKGFYHCFGCGAHGDALRFLTELDGLPFMEAVKMLAAQAGMAVPSPSPEAARRQSEQEAVLALLARAAEWFQARLNAPEGREARAYLLRRQVPDALAGGFGLGFAPGQGLAEALGAPEPLLLAAGLIGKGEDGRSYERFRGRLMFPIRDPRGRVLGFGGRALGDAQPKYLNSADGPVFDKGRILYNLDRAGPAARKAGRLVIVEGYMDVIGVAGAGMAELVAPLGTALTEAQMERAWQLVDTPILCFDGDAAGTRAALRACLRALPLLKPGRSLAIATLPPGEDPDDLVRRGGLAAFEAVLNAARPLEETLWLAETGAAPATPEARAAVRARLRGHAESIADPDCRALYRAAFDQRFEAAFLARPQRMQQGGLQGRHQGARAGGRWTGRGAMPPAPASAALKAMAATGPESAEAVAVISGLLVNPWLAEQHGEQLARIDLGAGRLARLRDAVLAAAARQPGLEAEALASHLSEAGLQETAARLVQGNRLPLRFCRTDPDRAAQARDFALVVDRLAARLALTADLALATAEFAAEGSEGAFRRQQALRAELDELDAVLMRLAESARTE
jgi:DNA primase